MSNQIKQYRPNFFTGFEDQIVDFDTLDELLNIEFVKEFSKDLKTRKFYRYSISDNMLMAEYNDGYTWWCIGRIKKPILVELPEWKAKYKENDKDGQVKENKS